MKKILVLHGPNLNLLGEREPHMYGRATLAEIDARLDQQARAEGYQVSSFQSNSEGALIDRVQQTRQDKTEFIIINAAGLSHTSLTLRDALVAVELPFIEVHLSNVYKRESFRHRSVLADVAIGSICGLGVLSYELALTAAISQLNKKGEKS